MPVKTEKNIGKLTLAVIVSALFALVGGAAARETKIVTTTSDMKSIAEEIGGNRVSVFSISSGRQDAHYIQAKPSFMLKAKRADLWIRVGLQLEIGYERLILEGSRNSGIHVGQPGHLDASTEIAKLEIPTGKVDRSMGDIHPFGNPHYWLDPYNGRVIAATIKERLSEIDPANEKFYEANLRSFLEKVDVAMFGKELVTEHGGDRLWELELAGELEHFLTKNGLAGGGWWGTARSWKNPGVVTYHRTWSYFAHRFGLDVVEQVEPKPGVPPSPRHILKVIKTIKSRGVKVILTTPYFSRKAPDSIARKTGAKVLVIANSIGGQKEAKDYVSLLDHVVSMLDQAFTD